MRLTGGDIDLKLLSHIEGNKNKMLQEPPGNDSLLSRMWPKRRRETHGKSMADANSKSGEALHQSRGSVLNFLHWHIFEGRHFYLNRTVEELLPSNIRENHQADEIKNGLVQVRAGTIYGCKWRLRRLPRAKILWGLNPKPRTSRGPRNP